MVMTFRKLEMLCTFAFASARVNFVQLFSEAFPLRLCQAPTRSREKKRRKKTANSKGQYQGTRKGDDEKTGEMEECARKTKSHKRLRILLNNIKVGES